MKLNRAEFVDKVLGCWLGKNIGGTLGAPMEWYRQINNVTFYTQDLGGEPLPNDDLDLQLVWLLALEEQGLDIDAHTLAEYWMLYITPHYSEYGAAKTNLRCGMAPPLCGTVDNPYKDSCGAFIRSEIWACIAPGLPALAAKYAYDDAIVDHGNGEGTYAAVFTAVMESVAFVVGDIYKIIDIACSYIPSDSGVAKAVQTAIDCYEAEMAWQDARDKILQMHRGLAFFGDPQMTSVEDHEKGFFDGPVGYDVPSNIGMLILGILYGEGDFDKTICITVNCGEDTDCTAATVGAIFGILHGEQAIPQKWIDPIGRGIKTLCINNSELCTPLPNDVDELTTRTVYMTEQLLMKYRKTDFITSGESDVSDATAEALYAKPKELGSLYNSLNGPKFEFSSFTVCTDYCEGPFISNGQLKKVRVTVHNKNRIPAALTLHWYLPEGEWSIAPGKDAYCTCQQRGYCQPAKFEFEISCANVIRTVNRAMLEITVEGRAEVLPIPFTFVNRNGVLIKLQET